MSPPKSWSTVRNSKLVAAIDIKTNLLRRGKLQAPVEIGAAFLHPETGAPTVFSTLVNPGLGKLFKPEYRNKAALAQLPLHNLSDPRLKAALLPNVHSALSVTGITPGEILEKGVSKKTAFGRLRGFLRQHGINKLTSYKTQFDKPIAALRNVEYPVDLLEAASTRAGEMGLTPWLEKQGRYRWISAQKAASIFIGPEYKQMQRAGEDAVLSARLYQKLFPAESSSIIKSVVESKRGFSPWLIAGGIGAALIGGAALAHTSANSFSAKDDQYNTLPGMNETGMAAQLRHLNTQFGSGYINRLASELAEFFFEGYRAKKAISKRKRKDPQIEALREDGMAADMRHGTTDFGSGYKGEKRHHSVAAGLAGGTAGSLLAWRYIHPGAFGKATGRLAKLREMSGGMPIRLVDEEFRVLTNNGLFDRLSTAISKTILRPLFGPLDLQSTVDPTYKGLQLINTPGLDIPAGVKGLNVENPTIGVNKYLTAQYLDEAGLGHLQPAYANAADVISGSRVINNPVIKRNLGARGEAVWMGLEDVPASVLEHMKANPQRYMFQEKLNLAGEFRVVTAGDKPIFMAHRFGSKELQGPMNWVRNKLGWKTFGENVQPVMSPSMRSRLGEFASQVSSKLPYEVGAVDIGLTTAGELRLIELQRSFGTLRHPLVSRRLSSELTGSGKGSLLMFGALGALLGYSLFSAKDDNYNSIEGMRHGGMAQDLRRKVTDFGSGFIYKLPAELSELGFKGLRISTKAVEPELMKMAKQFGLADKAGTQEAIRKFATHVNVMSKGDQVLLLNPFHIEMEAARRGMRTKDVYSKVIRHEAFHARKGYLGKVVGIPKDMKILEKFASRVPESWKTAFQKLYKDFEISTAQGGVVEEWFANAIETAYDKGITNKHDQELLHSMYDRAWNILGVKPVWEPQVTNAIIEAGDKGSKSMATGRRVITRTPRREEIRKLVMAEQQKQTAQAASINGLMGGKGHITYHNKKVE